ncbi:MAG: DoxX family protein [Rickettsiales bacterium]
MSDETVTENDKASICGVWARAWKILDPIVLLLIRLYMGNIYFASGMSKLDNYLRDDWASTIYIFQDIYPIPHVPAEWVAPVWTAAELVLPVLLVLGLASRFAAFGMLVIVGLMEVSLQLSDPEYVTLDVNIMWGLLLAVLVVRGAGFLSVDKAICSWCRRPKSGEA